MRSAAQRYCIEDRSALPDKSLSERDLSKKMIREVLTALRLFVNDGPNQLYFAINEVAKNFLKPPSETSPGGKIPAQNCRATFFACTVDRHKFNHLATNSTTFAAFSQPLYCMQNIALQNRNKVQGAIELPVLECFKYLQWFRFY